MIILSLERKTYEVVLLNLVKEGKAKPILDEQMMNRLRESGVEYNPILLQQVDKDEKYVCKSICDTLEVLTDDSNIIKLNNYKLDEAAVMKIQKAVKNIENNGGGIR
ncbi:hypothetical protein COJ42_24925 [Bacillus cereus]|uniref:hypothetical protein n=1 Tax=Bacillus paramycoides TaxID=2026194 RepID=UPI0006ACF369|nr:hypothetical protein CN464_27485 [Bacillus cereus]PFM28184.1 hypothetical protein COJ42_24925 [Bacillus cereus]PFP85443.1 hypothetical protein COK02_24705 [Bacillus cereus]